MRGLCLDSTCRVSLYISAYIRHFEYTTSGIKILIKYGLRSLVDRLLHYIIFHKDLFSCKMA